jgi:hypothetical protein
VRRLSLTIVLAAAAALPGCLFDAPVLPGPPQAVDARLPGAWRCITPESEDAMVLTITRQGDRGYRAEFKGGDDAPMVFAAQAVTRAGKTLLNAQELAESGPQRWTVARYTLLRPGVLHLEAARESALKDAAGDAARLAAFDRALAKGEAFEDFCTCVRIATR